MSEHPTKESGSDRRARLYELMRERAEKAEAERDALREFFDAWTARENETTDFDLHAATVERFRKAHDAVVALERPE